MNNSMKGWSNAWLDFAVCMALSSASVLAIEALATQHSKAAVSDSLNAASAVLIQTTLKPACH